MCFIGNEVGIAKPATRPGGLAPESVARGPRAAIGGAPPIENLNWRVVRGCGSIVLCRRAVRRL